MASLGVVSIAGGTTLGILSLTKTSDAKSQDQPTAYNTLEEADSYALWANVAFAVGGAALATATTILILDILDEPHETPPQKIPDTNVPTKIKPAAGISCNSDGCGAILSIPF